VGRVPAAHRVAGPPAPSRRDGDTRRHQGARARGHGAAAGPGRRPRRAIAALAPVPIRRVTARAGRHLPTCCLTAAAVPAGRPADPPPKTPPDRRTPPPST